MHVCMVLIKLQNAEDDTARSLLEFSPMSTNLQKADVERLMAQPSPHMRAVVASKLARELDNPELTETELTMAQDLVRLMAQDIQMIVRQALAHNLRRSNKLPHDVALRLANDVEAVALPILLDSEILTDADLLQFIRGSSVVKQKAVASRPKLSQETIDEIIRTTNEVVVTTLIRNEKAPITDPGLHQRHGPFQHQRHGQGKHGPASEHCRSVSL